MGTGWIKIFALETDFDRLRAIDAELRTMGLLDWLLRGREIVGLVTEAVIILRRFTRQQPQSIETRLQP